MVQYRPLNLLADFAQLRPLRRRVLPQRADLFRSGDQDRRAQPHRQAARAGRLPGARRGRDRGRPDRCVQADARQARPLCAEQGCAKPAALDADADSAARGRRRRAEPYFTFFRLGWPRSSAARRSSPRASDSSAIFSARVSMVVGLGERRAVVELGERDHERDIDLAALARRRLRQHGAMRGEQRRVGEQPLERAARRRALANSAASALARCRMSGGWVSSGREQQPHARRPRPAAGLAVHCASGIARSSPRITGVIQANSENDTS